jgi:hypothetical protein
MERRLKIAYSSACTRKIASRTAATPQMVTMNPCFRLLFRCEPTLQVVPRPTIGRKTMFCSHSSHISTLQTNSGPFTLHPTVCPVLTSFICQSPYPPRFHTPAPYLLTYSSDLRIPFQHLAFKRPQSLPVPSSTNRTPAEPVQSPQTFYLLFRYERTLQIPPPFKTSHPKVRFTHSSVFPDTRQSKTFPPKKSLHLTTSNS